MTKNTPSNTASAAIDAAIAAASPLPQPPAHVKLRAEHMPFWEGVLRERARREWTPATLVIAAQLARCQYDIERETDLLEDEGTVIEKQGRGDTMIPFANPRVGVLEALARREMALMRTLGVAGSALGDKRNVQKGRELERRAGEVQAETEAEEDPLLA